jgi:hypothetical protein
MIDKVKIFLFIIVLLSKLKSYKSGFQAARKKDWMDFNNVNISYHRVVIVSKFRYIASPFTFYVINFLANLEFPIHLLLLNSITKNSRPISMAAAMRGFFIV